MSLMGSWLGDGYYDDEGNWQRTKFCFMACEHCTCQPPGLLYYSKAHDKRLRPPDSADAIHNGSTHLDTCGWKNGKGRCTCGLV